MFFFIYIYKHKPLFVSLRFFFFFLSQHMSHTTSQCSDEHVQPHSFTKVFAARMHSMSHGMRFPTMWYVRPAKLQISLRIVYEC